MKTVFHPEASRGHADHGWLNAKHSFSFASWYNPERIHFGMLRVLNDDIVAGGMGFGKHPHDNMEIITIPLSGAIQHQDSMGFSEIIEAGEVQVMSAGTGIYHSEFNPKPDQALNLFQIWIFPNQKQVTPRYAQKKYNLTHGVFTQLVGPQQSGLDTWIHQDAWISLGEFDAQTTVNYAINKQKNGIYLMVVEGAIQIGAQRLQSRDAIGISEIEQIDIQMEQNSKILVIEVPMN
ncbi:MAG: pirin family protein [Crocinitomicaceae bacterium]|jgi:redox-sensitive bicupin YhaK (pirin superfamily)|nr:pirin family protein [Crocinitomicaceae bacterium]MDP4739620.1 pirin family protein [Crocinitomicaceae bacterium]MDP4800309.1 pirin family protein [Crocinitomicaceae bacterium]MDP4955880.1 pirin family protein [Crocinitomicaceae bacterium]MDP5043286.1 pirin family protein [Crocinitomicaceae bacterium]